MLPPSKKQRGHLFPLDHAIRIIIQDEYREIEAHADSCGQLLHNTLFSHPMPSDPFMDRCDAAAVSGPLILRAPPPGQENSYQVICIAMHTNLGSGAALVPAQYFDVNKLVPSRPSGGQILVTWEFMRKPPSPTMAITALSGFTSFAAMADGNPETQ